MRSLDLINPVRELEKMQSRLSRFFNDGLSDSLFSRQEIETLASTQWVPSVDIIEDDKEYLVKADLPEIKKEDVHVSLEDGVLSISGERKHEKEEKGRRFHRLECDYGNFVRSFTLPESADSNKVNAEFKDGVLRVHVAKTSKPKQLSTEIKIA